MRYLLIPVKDLSGAKQRLAALLTQAERTQLAWAMLEQTFAAAAQVQTVDRIAIVTLYPPAIALAEKYGLEVLHETEQISESASVDFGARQAQARGAEAVLRLPIDLPLITTQDIETILRYDRPDEPTVVIVPSAEGTGTNAILRRPPTLFPSRFGPDSLSHHLHAARQLGAHIEIVHLPRIALDIDTPEDLAALLATAPDSPLTALLTELHVPERLRALADSSSS